MTKQYTWVYACILLLVGFTLYVLKINHTAGIDEIITFFKYTRSSSDILLYDAPNNHILHSFLVWLSTSLMGNSLLAIRLPAFTAGIISLALLYRLGTRWLNHYVGLIAMLLMLITISFVSYTLEGRGYTLTILFTILIIENIILGKDSTKSDLRAFFLSLGIILTMPSNVYLIVPIIGWYFIIGWHLKETIYFKKSIPYFLSLILGTAFYIVLVIWALPNGLNESFSVGHKNLKGFIYQTLRMLFVNPSLSIVLFGIFIWGVLTALQKYRQINFFLIAVIIGGAIVFSALQGIVTHKFFFPRNFLYLLPLVCLIGAVGIHRLALFHANLTAISIFAVFIIGLWGIHSTVLNPNVRYILKKIEEYALDNDILFVAPGYYEPVYYHIHVQKELDRDYFMPSSESDRFIIILDMEDTNSMIELHGLDPYISECGEESWGALTVATCNIVNQPYTRDESKCYSSIYPFWQKCFDEDGTLNE